MKRVTFLEVMTAVCFICGLLACQLIEVHIIMAIPVLGFFWMSWFYGDSAVAMRKYVEETIEQDTYDRQSI
jgi:hypothetical protein